jgi:hypothetical protein
MRAHQHCTIAGPSLHGPQMISLRCPPKIHLLSLRYITKCGSWFCYELLEMDMKLLVNCRQWSLADRAFMYFWLLQVLRTPLIHRDHPDSPLSKAAYNTSSYSERLAAAVKRSLARRDYFSRRLMSSTVDGGFESQVIPDETFVQYDGLTEYTMALSIGTPPQRFFVLIDTGSDLLWLNCKPCNQCIIDSFGSPFDPSLSSSYRNTSCTDNFCKVRTQNASNEKLLPQIIHLAWSWDWLGISTEDYYLQIRKTTSSRDQIFLKIDLNLTTILQMVIHQLCNVTRMLVWYSTSCTWQGFSFESLQTSDPDMKTSQYLVS